MIVDETMIPLPNGASAWLPDQSGATECRVAPAETQNPHEHTDGDPAYPLVSSPPLITRIFPGL